MEIIRVRLSLEDKAYAAALMRGMSRECSNMSFVREDEATDVVLSDAASPASFENNGYAYLTGEENGPRDRPDILFRYEDCRKIVNRLTYLNYLHTGKNLEFRGTSAFRLLTFVSGAGGAGVSSLCLSFGKMMAILYGSRCLYLSMTPLSGFFQYTDMMERPDVQGLFCRLENDPGAPVEDYITAGGYLDFLSAPWINHYMTELSGHAVASLMTALDRLGRYDFVLADVGNTYAGGALSLLRGSDAAIYVADAEREATSKQEEKVFSTLRMDDVSRIRVENRARMTRDAEHAIEIRFCPMAFRQEKDKVEIDLNSSYGADVSVLCNKVIGEVEKENCMKI